MNLETPVGMSLSATRTETLKDFVTEIFSKLGVPSEAARLSATALVAADVEGMSSHGVTLVPLYVERILAGSVSTDTEPTVVHDGGSAIVLDAGHSLGQLSSDWALPMVSERAREHGVACIAVRNGSHFGAATFWARQIAESGLVGIAMCNSRPLKRANSMAIALPSRDLPPLVAELESSASAADPASAVAALLLANSGARGFGLAAAIDLLCGGLSGGALGPDVGAFNGDPATPYRASHLFLAIDPARFGISDLDERVAQFAERIPSAKRSRRTESGDECLLPPELLARLRECGEKVGVESRLE